MYWHQYLGKDSSIVSLVNIPVKMSQFLNIAMTIQTYRSLDRISLIFTQRNLFEILLNQAEADCIYHFPIDLEQHKPTLSVWFQINRKMVYTIWFRVDLIKFRKDFSVFRKTKQIDKKSLQSLKELRKELTELKRA